MFSKETPTLQLKIDGGPYAPTRGDVGSRDLMTTTREKSTRTIRLLTQHFTQGSEGSSVYSDGTEEVAADVDR